MDQASTLRQIHGEDRDSPRQSRKFPMRMRVIAITSGKGGVGKTNIVINLALALSRKGRKIFLLDADMGLANVDVLLGLTPQYTLEHVMRGEKTIQEIIMTGPEGFRILPSGSGISELSEMTYEQQMLLFQELSKIDDEMDYLLIDTGAGISSNVMRFNASANEVIIIANAEPTSITDAYALMKLLAIKYHIRDFGLIANSVASAKEGKAVYDTLNQVCGEFLQVNLFFLGWVPFDTTLRKCVRHQQPLLTYAPTSPAAKNITAIANLIESRPIHSSMDSSENTAQSQSGKIRSFWDRLLHWKKL